MMNVWLAYMYVGFLWYTALNTSKITWKIDNFHPFLLGGGKYFSDSRPKVGGSYTRGGYFGSARPKVGGGVSYTKGGTILGTLRYLLNLSYMYTFTILVHFICISPSHLLWLSDR